MTCVESLSDVVVVNIKSYKDDRGNFYKLFDDELKRYSKLKNPILEVNRSLTKKKVRSEVCIFSIHPIMKRS